MKIYLCKKEYLIIIIINLIKQISRKKILLSGNFKGNIEKEKLRLKFQNEYQNVFFITEEEPYEIYPGYEKNPKANIN